MKNITKDLMDEHQNILRVIALSLKECDNLESGKPLNKGLINDIVLFIRKYADGFHHAKEEDILFVAMLENQQNLHCNPIPVMLSEHDAGRQYVKAMIEALDKGSIDELVENIRGYCFLLSQHIYKEDNVLYPMAEDALQDEQKTIVEATYAAVQQSDFIHMDIHLFIDSLEQRVNS